jgi:hypothetical protein
MPSAATLLTDNQRQLLELCPRRFAMPRASRQVSAPRSSDRCFLTASPRKRNAFDSTGISLHRDLVSYETLQQLGRILYLLKVVSFGTGPGKESAAA